MSALRRIPQHVADGENRIARQQQIITELASGGYDLETAQDLLAHFEYTEESHVADRDRLRAQLAAIS